VREIVLCRTADSNDLAVGFHTVPHARYAGKMRFAEVLDLIRDVVSPEGIEPARPSPKGEGRVTDDFRARQLEAAGRELVSPEGIEPSTNRLRVFARARSVRRRS
jgi:hypothetical protein